MAVVLASKVFAANRGAFWARFNRQSVLKRSADGRNSISPSRALNAVSVGEVIDVDER